MADADFDLVARLYDKLVDPLPDDADDLSALPRPGQVVVLAWWAKGLIDNGGFQFFYEGACNVIDVAWAFDELGMPDAADACRDSARVFPHGIPHDDQPRRLAWMGRRAKRVAAHWEPLDDVIHFIPNFAARVAEYVRRHRAVFDQYLGD